jgi:hypothetical protein
MEIKPLDDVMSYFQYTFFAYIVLFIVISLNYCKALYITRNFSCRNSAGKFIKGFDLFIDILCGMAMLAGLMFQGVLADNNALGHNNWLLMLLGISLVSFIVIALNAMMVLRGRKRV